MSRENQSEEQSEIATLRIELYHSKKLVESLLKENTELKSNRGRTTWIPVSIAELAMEELEKKIAKLESEILTLKQNKP